MTSNRYRLSGALVFGGVALAYSLARAWHEPQWPTDFDQLWHAARALRDGVDPYSVVGPGRSFQWDWPLYYPLPAVLLTLPFSVLPVTVARVTFATLAGALLGWAMSRRVLFLWPAALSAAFLIATSRTQWSPLLLAAAWVPWLAFVAMAKPNVGLAAFAPHASRWRTLALAAVPCVILVGASLLIQPDWLSSWRTAIADAPHIVPPVLRAPGFLLLLAGLRWRRPEARLLLVLSCVPHTPSLYDVLPLFFVCRTLRESLALALLTHLAFWGNIVMGGSNTFAGYAEGLGRFLIVLVYLPSLVAILRRPNAADAQVDENSAIASDTLPTHRLDLVLAGLLLVAAFFLVWLPLVTRR